MPSKEIAEGMEQPKSREEVSVESGGLWRDEWR